MQEQLSRVLVVVHDPEVSAFIGECLSPFTQVPQQTTFVESLAQLRAQAETTLVQSPPDVLIFGDQYLAGESGMDVLLTQVGGRSLYEVAQGALFSSDAERPEIQHLYRPFNVGVFIPKPVTLERFQDLIGPLFRKK